MRGQLLIVDDEADIVRLLKDYFEMNGYTVMTAADGEEAMKQAARQPDLILLDINLPGRDGLSVCGAIRDHVACPILFLTAKVEEADRIDGLRAGGDDYIVKPFSLDELGARVDAHLRREQRQRSRTRVSFTGDLTIDYSERTVSAKGEFLALAKKEFDIIELLSTNTGQIFDKERIYERLWGYDSEGDSSVVAEHIRRIRAKLGVISDRTYIATVWGVGYKWVG
ncbi:response regulator transcription factor [Cohnella sp. AR92]|uniref:response regulator transcription factor n=1 Tax=Cohnella sp. AR92 TaxID=648716 RepID=UPI000F8EB000|nr:response regulator transcription factor [Cohnella sp. AR92]RUS48622.1 response regulator transcription factor [Cohnella sp. AR92]